MGDFLLVVLGQFAADQCFLVIIQPAGLMHAVLEVAQYQQANKDGRHGFQDKHPLPAGPAMHAGEVVHDPAGERATDHP
ncbi:hypothetical protein D3C76_1795720 [compost metagenome]